MHQIDKNQIAKATTAWVHDSGYWITLNTRTKDRILFEEQLQRFVPCLNDFCYGREFARKEKRLRIVAGIEFGTVNAGLHSHLLVTHKNDTRRKLQEINEFVRKRWYKLNNFEGSFLYGRMADVQPLGNAETRIDYMVKDIDSKFYEKFNLIYL